MRLLALGVTAAVGVTATLGLSGCSSGERQSPGAGGSAELGAVSDINPQFAAVLRACHKAQLAEDYATAEGLMAWLMAQPNVGHSVKKMAGLKGDVDHTASLAFLRGRGFVLVLAGLVDVPPEGVRGWGVFAHGFTLGKDCPAASRICKQLASEGIGMLRNRCVGGN